MVDRVFRASKRPIPAKRRRADEQVAQSFQVLGQQFHSVMDFPRVGEILDKEKEDAMLDLSRRTTNNKPVNHHIQERQENQSTFKKIQREQISDNESTISMAFDGQEKEGISNYNEQSACKHCGHQVIEE